MLIYPSILVSFKELSPFIEFSYKKGEMALQWKSQCDLRRYSDV